VLGDGFQVAGSESKDVALQVVRPGPIGIDRERLGREFVGPLEVAFRVPGAAEFRQREELIPKFSRAWTLLGSMASACSQSAKAASASLPIPPAFTWPATHW
jgi:hypothetical protein